MHSHKKFLFGILLILCIVSIPSYSKAIDGIGLQESDITASTQPENPEPYQDVTISLVSYATDLNKATIEWRSGSKVLLSGIGRTNFSIKAPGPNVTAVYTATITPVGDTNSITKQIIISPSDIEVLWESVDGYTPPFYKGKSFASPESLIKVVAIPDTSAVKSSSNLVYTWKNNGKTIQSASGYGKDSYIFANNELNRSEEITVSASTVDGSYNATKTINIPIIDPKIVFYKRSPTDGVLYNSALVNDVFMSGDEFTIVATPYFLATLGNEDKFTYSWQINGNSISTPSKKTELTVRPSSRGGYATIGVTMENLNTFFQKVTGQLKINL
ncbi:MAG: hypothetical protein KGI58_00215 [Patescibacteria group bacterium]|nr:hypothetical protein [Patescibacteria group bacterium]